MHSLSSSYSSLASSFSSWSLRTSSLCGWNSTSIWMEICRIMSKGLQWIRRMNRLKWLISAPLIDRNCCQLPAYNIKSQVHQNATHLCLHLTIRIRLTKEITRSILHLLQLMCSSHLLRRPNDSFNSSANYIVCNIYFFITYKFRFAWVSYLFKLRE